MIEQSRMARKRMSWVFFQWNGKISNITFHEWQIACFRRILCAFVLDKRFNDVHRTYTTLIVVLFYHRLHPFHQCKNQNTLYLFYHIHKSIRSTFSWCNIQFLLSINIFFCAVFVRLLIHSYTINCMHVNGFSSWPIYRNGTAWHRKEKRKKHLTSKYLGFAEAFTCIHPRRSSHLFTCFFNVLKWTKIHWKWLIWPISITFRPF